MLNAARWVSNFTWPINSAAEPRPSSSWWIDLLQLCWENWKSPPRDLQVGHGLNASLGKCAGGIWSRCSWWFWGDSERWSDSGGASLSGPLCNHLLEELHFSVVVFSFARVTTGPCSNHSIWKFQASDWLKLRTTHPSTGFKLCFRTNISESWTDNIKQPQSIILMPLIHNPTKR